MKHREFVILKHIAEYGMGCPWQTLLDDLGCDEGMQVEPRELIALASPARGLLRLEDDYYGFLMPAPHGRRQEGTILHITAEGERALKSLKQHEARSSGQLRLPYAS